jgi:hypothetical protein
VIERDAHADRAAARRGKREVILVAAGDEVQREEADVGSVRRAEIARRTNVLFGS